MNPQADSQAQPLEVGGVRLDAFGSPPILYVARADGSGVSPITKVEAG